MSDRLILKIFKIVTHTGRGRLIFVRFHSESQLLKSACSEIYGNVVLDLTGGS